MHCAPQPPWPVYGSTCLRAQPSTSITTVLNTASPICGNPPTAFFITCPQAMMQVRELEGDEREKRQEERHRLQEKRQAEQDEKDDALQALTLENEKKSTEVTQRERTVLVKERSAHCCTGSDSAYHEGPSTTN